MNNTFQFQNQTILQHGLSVHNYYKRIIKALDTKDYSTFKFPQELIDNWPRLKKLLYHNDIMKHYHIFHDCGKPFCQIIDEQGKKHFPNHARISYEKYCEIYRDDQIAELILNDMSFHSGTPEELIQFFKDYQGDDRFIFSLWMTSLAEIYSNSAMFAADNQKSFIKKYDKLERIFKLILDNITKYDRVAL